MESWHRVGQAVMLKREFVGTPWINITGRTDTEGPAYGEVCQISEVDCWRGEVILAFVGHMGYFTARDFRPVRETSIEQFRALLTPTPEVCRALEDA